MSGEFAGPLLIIPLPIIPLTQFGGFLVVWRQHASGGESSKGRIPNFAVTAEFRGQGLGRRLIEHALVYFRREGLAYAMIETMAQNEAGQHLYPACGFLEVARQVHFARRL